MGLLLEHPVDEIVLGLLDALSGWLLLVDGARHGALEDVLLLLGEVGKYFGR